MITISILVYPTNAVTIREVPADEFEEKEGSDDEDNNAPLGRLSSQVVRNRREAREVRLIEDFGASTFIFK